MTEYERKTINALKGVIVKQNSSTSDKNSEIRYLRLQLSRIKSEIEKILNVPSSTKLTNDMKGIKPKYPKEVRKSLSRG